MQNIFTYIYPINHPNVGKHTIHGASGCDVRILGVSGEHSDATINGDQITGKVNEYCNKSVD